MKHPALFALLAFACFAACSQREIDTSAKSLASAAPALANDGLIIAQIESRFVQIDGNSALHVAVASHDGNVRLSGRTRTSAIGDRYLAAAKAVGGVKTVVAALRPDATLPDAKRQVSDFALATAVRANLTGQAGLNGIGIDIKAAAGTITLRGHVKSAALHATLVDAARQTSGVRTVVDELKVDS